MNITITGSLGNISKPLVQQLVKAKHQVRVISSSEGQTSNIEALGAEAAIGSIMDVEFLTKAFKDADVVYTMTPNNFAATDQRGYMVNVGECYAAAIQQSGVKNVVNLSSIGADLVDGTGPIKGLHDVECILNALSDINLKHLRAAFFYTNFYNDIALIKKLGFTGSNYASETSMVMVHPKDIATEIAKQIDKGFTGKSVSYVYSDQQSASTVALVLGAAIDKPEMPWIQFSNAQLLDGMLQAGLPSAVAKNYVEMGEALGAGLLNQDFELNRPEAAKTKLEIFAREFAERFKNQG